MTVKREFELSEEDAAFVDSQAAKDGANPDEVVGAAIDLLRQEEDDIGRWLRDKVIPTHDRWKAGKERVYTEEEVSDYLDQLLGADDRTDAAE
jgi:Arc/MetJ-type ribon-helix-helix transcriptional regulator